MRQPHVLLVSMYLRNAIEDFHVAHLSDEQMKELNQLIRQALYDIVSIIEDDYDSRKGQLLMSLLVDSIPSYWEIPAENTAG